MDVNEENAIKSISSPFRMSNFATDISIEFFFPSTKLFDEKSVKWKSQKKKKKKLLTASKNHVPDRNQKHKFNGAAAVEQSNL